ncbi:MAG: two-component system response regulator [Acidobacteria bacterium]|jgi:CheY-like chemotaxis protein|nr:MAG: two-component system response regulator [Acidobacteriota bacterium]
MLVVDDDPPTLAWVAQMISHCEYEIRVAYGGAEAVSVAKDFHPDCVVTGIVMPNMDGFEEAKEILKFLPNCKFILMSGSAHLQEIQDGHKALGFDLRLLLEKPFTLAELLAALQFAGFPCVAQ